MGNVSQSAAPQQDMHAKRRDKHTDPELDVLIGDAVRRAQEASQTLNAFAELVKQIGTLASDPRQPLLLTVNEAAEALGVGRSTVYDMVARDELPAVTLGKSMRIRRADIERYVETLPKAKRRAS
ncbi:helix-turn-helix domain-containing protein [Enemella evansiae]|uniref:helix-turn-helix domain-containing protein n=1 Tax=Enemella evansiae TaxID=2016499 RepID=UPI001E52D025|nr:helix-turn-helix domain-containing protein [Enemella evansiae]